MLVAVGASHIPMCAHRSHWLPRQRSPRATAVQGSHHVENHCHRAQQEGSHRWGRRRKSLPSQPCRSSLHTHLPVRAASGRMEHLLGRSDLFRMWRKSKPNADCLDVRSGDTTLPLCGLSTHACAELAQSVTHVIHCAASIAFDEAMHESLRQNYEVRHARTRMRSGSIATLYVGSRLLSVQALVTAGHPQRGGICSDIPETAAVCTRIDSVRQLVHAQGRLRRRDSATIGGSAFRYHRPRSNCTRACLPVGVRRRSPGTLSCSVDSMPSDSPVELWLTPSRCVQGAFYLKDVGLPNNYTFTKNLAEQLMQDLHTAAFPVSIVRPAIVSCLNGPPAPGYFGNTSGAIAFVMAFATGDQLHLCIAHCSPSDSEAFRVLCAVQGWLTTPVTIRTTTSKMSSPVIWWHP